jgi:O-antigen/teichoic acid export membrane protein
MGCGCQRVTASHFGVSIRVRLISTWWSGPAETLGGFRSRARGSILASVAVLAGGTAAGQVLTVAAAPALTRLYSPDDLGRLALYMAFVNVASVGTSLRYELAIVAAPTKAEAALLTVISLVAVAPTSVLLAIGMYVMISTGLLGFDGLPAVTCAAVLVSLVLSGAGSALRYWFVRQEAFPIITRVLVWQGGVRSLSQIGLGATGVGWSGLLIGDLFGRAFGVSRMMRLCWPSISPDVFPLHVTRLLQTLRAYSKFPIYNLPSAVIDSLSVSIVVPLVSQIYGTESAGFFSLVYSVLALPVTLVTRSVADVFHGRMALYARQDQDAIRRLFFSTSAALLLIGFLPTLGAMALGPTLFGWIFGERWTIAGQLAGAIAPWMLASLVVSPLSRVIEIFQAQEFKFIYDLSALVGVVVALWAAGALRLDLLQAVQILSSMRILGYVIYFGVLLKVILRPRRAST